MSSISCKWCHVDGLHWVQIGERWRLHYQSGQPHLCRTTRDKLSKSLHARPIGPPTREQHLIKHLTQEGVRWAMKQKPKEEVVPLDMHDPWWDFLNIGEARRGEYRTIAKQEILEMIP